VVASALTDGSLQPGSIASFALEPDAVAAFLLMMIRVVTVLTVAPPFRGATVPMRVRAGIAAAVSFLVASDVDLGMEMAVLPLVVAAAYQVLVGAFFGLIIQILLTVPLIAGAMIDGVSGLSASSLFDPTAETVATPTARLAQLLTSLVLIGTGGHLLIVRGVIRSYQAAPLAGFEVDALGDLLGRAAGQLLLAAIEVALPVLVALLMAETVLALAARAAPRLNVMVVGFAVKALILMLTFSISVPLLVNAVARLLDQGIRWALTGTGA
jgi:flagellar biosynthetic protein FliR